MPRKLRKMRVFTAATALTALTALSIAEVKTYKNTHDASARHLTKVDDVTYEQGMSFNDYLAREYRAAAGLESNDWDIDDVRMLENRAATASNGTMVEPMMLNNIEFVGATRSELNQARNRLVTALNSSSGQKHPETAARAQVAFDCWAIQQKAGPAMSHNMASCKSTFMDKLAMLKEHQQPKMTMVDVNVANKDAVDVYFDFDSATLSQASKKRLDAFKNHIKNVNKEDVMIKGYADTAGPAMYNKNLSQQRAKAVASYLGISPRSANIEINAYGENSLPVATQNGVPLQANRVVKVMVEGTVTKQRRLSINQKSW